MFTGNFTVTFFGHVSFHAMFACLQLHATTNIQPHLELDFQHSWPWLQTLGIARENQVKVSAVTSDKYKGMLNIVLGPCSLKADGEVSLAWNETATEWVLTVRNKCVSLEVSLACFLYSIIVCVFQIIRKGQVWPLKLF